MKALRALNLKQMERCLGLSMILMALNSPVAFADTSSAEVQLDSSGNFVSCSTSSRGRSFNLSDDDYSTAQSNVIRQCQIDPVTSNSECSVNVRCSNSVDGSGVYGNGGVYGNPLIRCDTSSSGRGFSAENLDAYLAQDSAIRQCQQDPYTSNSECSNNVSCSGGGTGGYNPGNNSGSGMLQRCVTSSQNQRFEATHIDPNIAQEQALGRCESQRYTSRYECEANLYCSADGPSPGYGGYPSAYPAPAPQPRVVIDRPLPQPRPQVVILRPQYRPQPRPQGVRPQGPQPRPIR